MGRKDKVEFLDKKFRNIHSVRKQEDYFKTEINVGSILDNFPLIYCNYFLPKVL